MDNERNQVKLPTMKGEKKLECDCRENRSNGSPGVQTQVVVEIRILTLMSWTFCQDGT